MTPGVLRDTELRLERLIAAPPEQVFALWTDPRLLAQWWGPEGYTVPSLSLDLRPGGPWIATFRDPDGVDRTVSGAYRVIEPPRRLVFTWGWVVDGVRGHETEVTLTFEAVPGGTRLVLQQKEFQDQETCKRHGQGWSSSLNKLEKAVV